MPESKVGIFNMPNAEYHASPGLSASGAKMLLPPSCPALFKHEQDHPTHKDVFDFGSAAHKVVLGDDAAVIREVDADSWRTKAAQEEREEARANGEIPLLSKDYAVVQAMAAELRKHPIASKLFDRPGKVEPSLFWADGRTGVQRRAKLDKLPDTDGGRIIVADYKSARSVATDAVSKALWDYGYAMQADFHSEAIRALEIAEEVAFIFVFQMKDPPYLVTVDQPDVEALRIGHERNERAIDIYKACTESGHWPGFAADVRLASLPGWATYQHDEQMETA